MSNEYAHLTPLEPAARIYCAKTGLDPETLLPSGEQSPLVGMGPKLLPQWMFIAEDLLELSLQLAALSEGRRHPGEMNGAHHA